MRRVALLACVLVFIVAACGDGGPDGTPDGPESQAKISIVSPKDGDEIKASDAVIRIEVDDFEMVNKMGQEAKSGEGHVIYYIWNGFGEIAETYEVPTTQGQPANSGGVGFVALASAELENNWVSFIQLGKQKFAAQLVNSDNTPLNPPKIAEVTVTVKGPKPTPPTGEREPGSGKGGGEGGGGGGNRQPGGGSGEGGQGEG